MKKFTVFGLITASTIVGTYEAETEEKAIEKAMDDENGNHYVSICHQCSREVELGDIYEYEAEQNN